VLTENDLFLGRLESFGITEFFERPLNNESISSEIFEPSDLKSSSTNVVK
jgi:hypothetical protein